MKVAIVRRVNTNGSKREASTHLMSHLRSVPQRREPFIQLNSYAYDEALELSREIN